MKALAWIPYGSVAVVLGAIIGYHPPQKPLHAQTALATILAPADTQPATFVERWPTGWAGFDERWSAAWGAKGIRTIEISRGNKTVAADPLNATPRVSRETIVYEEAPPPTIGVKTPLAANVAAQPPATADICAIHHLRRVEYDHGRRWRCRR